MNNRQKAEELYKAMASMKTNCPNGTMLSSAVLCDYAGKMNFITWLKEWLDDHEESEVSDDRAQLDVGLLPQYKCHKIVGGLKIKKIVNNPNESVDLFFELDAFAPVNIPAPDSVRFKPFGYEAEGADQGYYVVYKDGYQSWSPTGEFEDGYTRI